MGSTAQMCDSDMHHCIQIQLSTSVCKFSMLITGDPAQQGLRSQALVHPQDKRWNANESPGHSSLVCNIINELLSASADRRCAAMSKAARDMQDALDAKRHTLNHSNFSFHAGLRVKRLMVDL